ncbi:MAG: metallo-mystery pair system four-Cys motif protein [Bdellovibrionales bacterium]|nr:metallo-mystery pair system four-Cys motif protein [Bdellovibrionales bacterium]
MRSCSGNKSITFLAASLLAAASLPACSGGGGSSRSEVAIQFMAVHAGAEVTCDTPIAGMGTDGATTVGMGDLRFFVSNVRLFDAAGQEIPSELIANDFQYTDETGSVALVDLTGNASGFCTDSAIAFSEGTARVNNQVVLDAQSSDVASIRFDIGVPQALMKNVLSTYSAEDAPSPMGELHWSWAGAYRNFVLNFTVQDANGAPGEGYVHVGSRDCGGNGVVALTDRDACGRLNTPQVELAHFNPTTDTVAVDVGELLHGLSFVTTLYDSEPPFNPIGQGVGAACHSAPVSAQPDCGPVFANLGVDASNGLSSASLNRVFSSN